MTICTRILEQDLKATWTCLSRVNTVDPEMLALMKKAGCYLISYGLESGSQKVLDQLDKGTTTRARHQGRRDHQGRWHQGLRLVHDRIAGRNARDRRRDDSVHPEARPGRDRPGRHDGVSGHGPVRHIRKDAKGLDWNKALAFNPSEADHSSVFLKCTDLDDAEIRRLFHKAMREAVLYNPRLVIKRLSHIASVRHLGRSAKRRSACSGPDGAAHRPRPSASGRRGLPLLVGRPHEELHVGHHLLHRGDVHLAGTETRRALLVADLVAVGLALLTEIQLARVGLGHVADGVAVLAEEQPAVGFSMMPCDWNGHGARRW